MPWIEGKIIEEAQSGGVLIDNNAWFRSSYDSAKDAIVQLSLLVSKLNRRPRKALARGLRSKRPAIAVK